MAIIGAFFVAMVVSSALLLSACMLVGRQEREREQANGLALEMSGRWPGSAFGGKYTTRLPRCSFEPEDLEDIQVVLRS
jgi:hypothetical protein